MSVIDPIDRNRFLPAIVTDVHNAYFFTIRTLINLYNKEEILNGSLLFRHNCSSDIFPIDWCKKKFLYVPKGN